MSRIEVKELEKRCGEVSDVLKSLAHPTRLLILCALSEKSRSVGELVEEIGISQSLMSQFLGRMKDEGLLCSERNGKSVIYQIKDARSFKLLRSLRDVFCPEE